MSHRHDAVFGHSELVSAPDKRARVAEADLSHHDGLHERFDVGLDQA